MNPQIRKIFRQVVFIVWIIGFYLLFGLILFDFNFLPVTAQTIFTISGISMLLYIGLATRDDKL
jgi:hypothetical protein